MKTAEVIAVIQILAGTAIILLSIIRGLKIQVPVPGKITKAGLIATSLAVLFLIGFAFSLLSLLANISFPIEVISGSLFLGSSCFVYLAIRLAENTRSNLEYKTSQHNLAKDKLKDLSLYDGLTGLYSRLGFFVLMENHLKLAQRQKSRVFLFYAGIDDLQGINDTLGYQEGDMMLKEAANVLKANFRRSDIIARISGDEFIVFLSGTSEDHFEAINNNFQKNLEFHNSKRNQKYKLTINSGVTYYDPAYNDSIDDMLAHAGELVRQDKTLADKSELTL
ncbi:MAG: GGDEF domain-containing protein [Nitrospirae bacterium]|nr:GGDEF domain-containing protein [Nitrospirota bacterium]